MQNTENGAFKIKEKYDFAWIKGFDSSNPPKSELRVIISGAPCNDKAERD